MKHKKSSEDLLFEAISTLKTPKECRKFFYDLCSPAELKSFKDRWCAAILLTEEIPYREISKQMGISTTTIGRAARFINGGSETTKKILKAQQEKI